jgi:hypothetical protein
MSEPTENDKDIAGVDANDLLQKASKEDQASVWCFSSLDEVKNNLKLTNYPDNKILDVGWDGHGKPLSFPEIQKIMMNKNHVKHDKHH